MGYSHRVDSFDYPLYALVKLLCTVLINVSATPKAEPGLDQTTDRPVWLLPPPLRKRIALGLLRTARLRIACNAKQAPM